MGRVDVPWCVRSSRKPRDVTIGGFDRLAVFLGFSAFIVYSTWAAMQGDHYRFGPYISPSFAELWGSTKVVVRPEAGVDARVGHRSNVNFVGSGRFPNSLAVITAAHTTKRFGPIRPTALLESRARAISARALFLSSCKIFALFRSI